jgi:hypothetical protein
MQCFRSLGVRHPLHWNFPLVWVAFISAFGGSPVLISQIQAFGLQRGPWDPRKEVWAFP